jgi:hypothetical protein
VLERLTPDIHRWTARHPEWHPRYAWAQEVACFAVTAGETLVLVTHGPPVVGGGREALRRGLEAPPWSLRSA